MKWRRRLFWKYVVFFTLLVTGALLASGAIEIYFSYQENKAALATLQREKAQGAAARIEGFITDIERQMGWVTQPRAVATATLEQRRFDFYRLQRQVPVITEVSYLDAAGREQVRISRLAPDAIGSQADLSGDPRFTETRARRLYRGPVYFRKESEPYMAIAIADGSAGGGGVTVAELNLKFIWDVVSQIRIGKAGVAFVVDGQGALIAHPDISLVLQKTDLSRLDQVRTALADPGKASDPAEEVTATRNLRNQRVLTAHVAIPSLGWTVFVEQPLEEAFEPLEASMRRTALLELAGIALAVLVSLVLARTMVKPIRALQTGAARFGEGYLGDRIAVRTGDELQNLAEQFNRMAERLQESYAGLERKVEERTHELQEALDQQTATAEVLRVISSSPTDLQPVLDAVAESAARLCDASDAQIFRVNGDELPRVAVYGSLRNDRRGLNQRITRGLVSGRAVLERRTIHVHDLAAELDDEYPEARPLQQATGSRTVVATPLLRESVPIGVILIRRLEVRPFSEKQIKLLETFADQAVIAIENVRLFQELQVRNRDLTETLEQQTATAEILRAISSSPTDLQPILDAVAQNAGRVCDATDCLVLRVDGVFLQLVANYGDVRGRPTRIEISPDWVAGRAVMERRTIHVPDLAAELAEYPKSRSLQERAGNRTTLVTPMLREGVPIGVIVIRRQEVRPFSEKQIALLQTFADQAVIAIENVRLFRELEARNRDLTESLEQQTATAQILRVISQSPTDLTPVFEAILSRALHLCEAELGVLFRYADDAFERVAAKGSLSPSFEQMTRRVMRPGPQLGLGRVLAVRRPVHIVDVTAEPAYAQRDPVRVATVEQGVRTWLGVPMLSKDQAVIGALVIYRREVRPFTDKQIELVGTFASQAVIAIENVRLFQELQARTQDLSQSLEETGALSEVIRAVSSSLDLRQILDTVARQAITLSDADGCGIFELSPGRKSFDVVVSQGLSQQFVSAVLEMSVGIDHGTISQAAETGRPVQIPDIEQAHGYPFRALFLQEGLRSVLTVPMGGGEVARGIVVVRRAPGEFDERIVGLMTALANQSKVAIANANLFREIEEKGRLLEVANRHKSEFLANMSHELRTPLNAIIGFSEVLLQRMFGALNEKQEEYLQDVLSSGRHLLSLINDILDLSKVEAGRMDLELERFELPQALQDTLVLVRERAARHGIEVGLDVDRGLGPFVADERKIKQVLLNLLSNAVKFTPEGGRIDVRAVLTDGAVEISVADTGIGIAPENQELIFEEFRQVGGDYAHKREGTGLGLTLARKLVELHGGRIWVKSQVGLGSTFTFSIPERPWPAS